uniref:Uncharacterized protein n=1 Tax=Anguilla anguilla TaxID=7936 RepID=A0A0E9VF67_ANGAN
MSGNIQNNFSLLIPVCSSRVKSKITSFSVFRYRQLGGMHPTHASENKDAIG